MTAEEIFNDYCDGEIKCLYEISALEAMEQYAKQENYKLLEKISIFVEKLKDEEKRNMGSDKKL